MNLSDKQRLWLFERILPLILVIVLPVALGLKHWFRESERRQREELIAALNELPDGSSIMIDSRTVTDPRNVIEALKTITESQPHHSSPTNPRLVQIKSDHESLTVCLARDSEVPSEYWVSTPRKDGCGPVSLGAPYFGVLKTNRLASHWDHLAK
ncbi:MAG: hypothetical protein ACTHQM_16240 [Thermoanaerobaculia bacterium]